MSDKIVRKNVQVTIGATEDLQVACELHVGMPPDGASITIYWTEEQAWEHRSQVYEALKDIKEERYRRGLADDNYLRIPPDPERAVRVTPEQLVRDATYETMVAARTPSGDVVFVPEGQVEPPPPGTPVIPAYTHARVYEKTSSELARERDEKLIELGAWREAARQVAPSTVQPTPANLIDGIHALRATIDIERKATLIDRVARSQLESLLAKAIAWRDWDGSRTRYATGEKDPQDELEDAINALAPKPNNAVLCPDCQRDPDPRGWTACAACRRLNGWA